MIIFFDATVVCQANANILARTGVWNVVRGIWEAINYIRLDDNQASIEVIPFSLHDKYDVLEIEDIDDGFIDISSSNYEFHCNSRNEQIRQISELLSGSPENIVILAPYGPIKDKLRIASSHETKIIHYIHDLIPIYSPELCSTYSIEVIRTKLNEIASNDIVLCNSQDTRNKIVEWWTSSYNDKALPNIEVIEPGIQASLNMVSTSSEYSDIIKILDGRPYFLSLSTIEPRKNIIRMLHAFNLFKMQYEGAYDVAFLLAGAEGWISDGERAAIENLCTHSNNTIIRLGYVEDKTADMLIKNTLGFVQVSLDEGYGLSVRTARSRGKVCICSALPSLKDSITDWDIYVDPYSIPSISRGMHRACLMQGRQLHRFNRSWRDVALELHTILSKL